MTGQLDPNTIANYFVPLNGGRVGSSANTPLSITGFSGIPSQTPSSNQTNYRVLVMGSAPPTIARTEQATPTSTATAPLISLPNEVLKQIPPVAPAPGNTAGNLSNFFWLHLLRPANPNSANMITEPKVVVDSFRFAYLVNNDDVDVTDPNNAQVLSAGTIALFSTRRLQPYRGGHFVPYDDVYNPASIFGFTEQTTPAPTQPTGTMALIPAFNATSMGAPVAYPDPKTVINSNMAGGSTLPGAVYHTLGVAGTPRDNWDYFPFHDRDFMSVAELSLVPDCPPGLFTKLFAELSPDPTTPRRPGSTPTSPRPRSTGPRRTAIRRGSSSAPPSRSRTSMRRIPAGSSSAPTPPPSPTWPRRSTTGPTRPGATWPGRSWHEYVEVPPAAFGYLGPVSSGQNADWLRRTSAPSCSTST